MYLVAVLMESHAAQLLCEAGKMMDYYCFHCFHYCLLIIIFTKKILKRKKKGFRGWGRGGGGVALGRNTIHSFDYDL